MPLPSLVQNWALVFARLSAVLLVFPAFSAAHFPARLRIGFAALLAYLVACALPGSPPTTTGLWSLMGLMGIEISVGMLLGFVSRIVFFALEAAGHVMAAEMGLSMTADFNPFSTARSEAPGTMLSFMAITLFFSADMHHWFLRGLQRSYELLPIGGARLSAEVLTDVVARSAQLFVMATLLAAPIMAVSFIISLVFSVLGRAVPQMNVFVESFAFRILGGLIVFGLTLNLMAQHIINWLHQLPEDVLHVAQLLGAR
jgi:flagellar biosynthetic protein FliR